MENSEIITQTLLKLDGWVLETDITEKELTDMDYNKAVTEDEVLDCYNTVIDYAKSYTQDVNIEDNLIFDTASILWTAGILWQKYNQNINNQLDETNPNPFGYGDKLVIQAKEMLKPFKKYSFNAY